MQTLLYVVVFTKNKDRLISGYKRVRRYGQIQLSAAPYPHYVYIIFLSYIQPSNGFIYPVFRRQYLKYGIVVIQLYIIKDIIRAVSDSGPFCQLSFRIYHIIRSVSEQELCMHVSRRS